MGAQDVCQCGDYRRNHVGGTGPCTMNGLGHGGPPACQKFRLSHGEDAEFEYWDRKDADDRDEASSPFAELHAAFR